MLSAAVRVTRMKRYKGPGWRWMTSGWMICSYVLTIYARLPANILNLPKLSDCAKFVDCR